MEIPMLKSWIHNLVMDAFTQALVDPGKIDIPFENSGPTYEPLSGEGSMRSLAQGVLTVTLQSQQSKDNALLQSNEAFYIQLKLADQKRHTASNVGNKPFEDTISFLVEDVKMNKLQIKCKTKRFFTTYTIAAFDLPLSNFPFELKNIVETTLEKKINKLDVNGIIYYRVRLEFTEIPIEDIDKLTEMRGDDVDSAISPTSPLSLNENVKKVDCCSGVLRVWLHSGSNLLGLDRNGMSDPYCVIYYKGKRIKTTHYICRTRNPQWNSSVDVIVSDYTKTTLSFLVYDWDGHGSSEDDFLGLSDLTLTSDKPTLLKHSLILGYKQQDGGHVANEQLGSIMVSVIFYPVPSVAMSETSTEDQAKVSKSRGFMNSAQTTDSIEKNKLTGLQKWRGEGPGILAQGYGLLEMHIIQGRDLMAMDTNGYSDPYCEVRVNNEKIFSTSCKKKTLNPYWDESVTLQLPKSHELLEITVWDRDPFFQKDFLGSIPFTLVDLKKQSDFQAERWFNLHKTRSGSIQLRFKVISAEEEVESEEVLSPTESQDSAVHLSTDYGEVYKRRRASSTDLKDLTKTVETQRTES
ncbi:DgyrCDS13491 [Dimorphilus gyrociliatus]|nr:DgyrCDS13491 [Dimorphilus gyrociliatus]